MRISSSKFASLEDIPGHALSVGSEIVGTAAGMIEVDIVSLYPTVFRRITLRADAAGPNNKPTSWRGGRGGGG
jgi:hypothetical protein